MGNSSSRERRQRANANVIFQQQQQQQQAGGARPPYGAPYLAPVVYPQRPPQALPPPPGSAGPGPYDASTYTTAHYVTNGQYYQSGWRTPAGPPPGYNGGNYPAYPQGPQAPSPMPPPPQPRGRPGAPTQEFTQTATIRNSVNLKKETLKLVPLEDEPSKLQIVFSFDASSACSVSTFVMATEEPTRCKIKTQAQEPGPPSFYERGLGHKFPKPHTTPHIVDMSLVPGLDAIATVTNGVYPLVIRLETLTEEGVREGRSLSDLPPGHEQKGWVQSQTTYATIITNEEGEHECRVMEQKIWVKGVSYKLQEIYGMDSAAPKATQSTEESEERLCVICLSNERDTTVLPCRHMCMCKECAQELSKQTSKCPICRNTVDSLLHIKVQRKSRSSRSNAATERAAAAAAQAQAQAAG